MLRSADLLGKLKRGLLLCRFEFIGQLFQIGGELLRGGITAFKACMAGFENDLV